MARSRYSGATGAHLEAAVGLDEIITAALTNWPLTAGSVVISHGDTPLIERDFGTPAAAPTAPAPAPAEALYQIGSISKAFTGSVISQLVDEGVLSLDDAVVDLLPWFTAPAGSEAATVRHLLHHTAGWIAGSDAVPGELAQAAALATTAVSTAPGTEFHYSNIGYIVLGLIVERVTGAPLADAVRSRILSPLGMSQSLSAILNADRHRFVGGTVPENDELPWLPGDRLAQAQWLEATGGDGNVASTASDLGKFAAALVAIGNQNPDGSTGTPRLFPTAMFTDLAAAGEPILEIGAHEPILASNYGYGLNVERVARGLMLSHGGGMVGYASFMLADLASGISVVVLTNAQGDQPIAELLARDLHLGLVELLADDDVIGYSPRHDRRLDPRRWGADEPGTGRFHSLSEPSLELTIAHLPDGSRTVTVAGETAELLWTLNGRATTAHPLLREYHLRFQPGQDKTGTAAGWVSGPREFRSAVGSDLAPPTGHAQNGRSPYLGRFRSYSPWFPYFEIVERSGGLVLCAPGGVEAPDDDIELVEIAPGRFRLGSDPRAPERLTFGPLSDGAAISANRDGCDYARQGRVVPTAPRTPLDAPVDVPTDVPSDVPSATTTVKRVSK